MDVYVLCYMYGSSFLSKASVKNYPLIGDITRFNKSLYVHRDDRAKRKDIY